MNSMRCFALFLGFPVFAMADCGNPECVAVEYFKAHISQDVETLYTLTVESKRGDLEEFADSYYEMHYTPSVFKEYWEENAHIEVAGVETGDKVSRVNIEGRYPDWISVATDRTMMGKDLISDSDWLSFVDALENMDVEMITQYDDVFLIHDEGRWRVLRPVFH